VAGDKNFLQNWHACIERLLICGEMNKQFNMVTSTDVVKLTRLGVKLNRITISAH
jgi:hypothetical protein